MHTKYRHIGLVVVEVDFLDVVNNLVSLVGSESVVVFLGHVQHELKTLGILALGDATDFVDGYSALDASDKSALTLLLQIINCLIRNDEVSLLLPVVPVELPHFVAEQNML